VNLSVWVVVLDPVMGRPQAKETKGSLRVPEGRSVQDLKGGKLRCIAEFPKEGLPALRSEKTPTPRRMRSRKRFTGLC
jgi:hypothetical protein